MDILNLILSLVSGAVGGNIGGAAVGDKSLGSVANTIIGLLGGGAGEYILKALGVLASASSGATGGSELDIGSILTTIGVSGVSGGVLTAVIGMIKDAMKGKTS